MNNWRLLLFAVLCTFQSISSEENPFNGRERCQLQRPEYLRRDTRFLEYESTPISENRRVNIRKESRGILGNGNDLGYSVRELKTHNEGFGDLRKADRIRSNDRLRERYLSRDRLNRESFDQRPYSRNHRRESETRNIREENIADLKKIDAQIRSRSLTRSLENNERSVRIELNKDNRRSFERDLIRTRDTSRSIEFHNRRTSGQREFETVLNRRVENNIRRYGNENNRIVDREFVQRTDLDESRNFRRESRTSSVEVVDRVRSVEDIDRRSNERLHYVQRSVRRNERQNVRAESHMRSFKLGTDKRTRSSASDALRRNNIRVSDSEFRPNTYRKLQNEFRMYLENRERRSSETNNKATRAQMRGNRADPRDSTIRAVREERQPLRNNVRDSDRNNRRQVFIRDVSLLSQRQFASEIQNNMRRQFTTRNADTERPYVNRITNSQRTRMPPMKDNRIVINGNERRESSISKRDSESRRNVEDKENLNDNRELRRQEIREVKVTSFRQNTERGNGQRLRMIENVRDYRQDIKNVRITMPITHDTRFSRNAKDEGRSHRTNDPLASSRGNHTDDLLTNGFELQHLLYVIQAVYLFGLFVSLPKSKGLKNKSWIGIWSNTPKLIKVD